MKQLKILLCTLIALSLYSCNNSINLKGSDFISTDVGTKYIYDMISTTSIANNSPKESTWEKTVKSCNSDKTQCSYEIKYNLYKSSIHKENILIEDGAVYSVKEDDSNNKNMHIPSVLEPNKTILFSSNYSNTNTDKTFKVVRILPTFSTDTLKFNNCIEININSKTTFKKPDIESEYQNKSIFCQKVGLVKESTTLVNKLKSVNKVNTVKSTSTLKSIKHPNK